MYVADTEVPLEVSLSELNPEPLFSFHCTGLGFALRSHRVHVGGRKEL